MWDTNIDQAIHLGVLVFFAFYTASFLSVTAWKHKFLLGYVGKDQILVTDKQMIRWRIA